jgi:hypothetical protein
METELISAPKLTPPGADPTWGNGDGTAARIGRRIPLSTAVGFSQRSLTTKILKLGGDYNEEEELPHWQQREG